MKNIFLLLITVLLFSCNCNKKETSSETTAVKNEVKTEFNIIVKDTVDDRMMLLGKINREGLSQEQFHLWFHENIEAHQLDTTTIKKIKPLLKNVTIKSFLGTWCSDSQREVPALYKILDAANFDFTNLEVVALDHKKETPNHLEKGMDIQYVPTFIFYKNGKEINRIVEAPQETLEKDILAILTNSGYKHIYLED